MIIDTKKCCGGKATVTNNTYGISNHPLYSNYTGDELKQMCIDQNPGASDSEINDCLEGKKALYGLTPDNGLHGTTASNNVGFASKMSEWLDVGKKALGLEQQLVGNQPAKPNMPGSSGNKPLPSSTNWGLVAGIGVSVIALVVIGYMAMKPSSPTVVKV